MAGKTAVLLPMTGPGVGAGHVARCVALGEALLSEDWHCILALDPGGRASYPAALPANLEITESPKKWTPETLAGRWPDGVALVVVDRYDGDASLERALHPWATKRLVIDDFLERPHDCELLLCIAPPQGSAPGDLDGVGTFLGGPAYALLRHEFWMRRVERLVPEARVHPTRHVIVSLGGSSQSEALSAILQGLAGLSRPLQIRVVGSDKGTVESLLRPGAPFALDVIGTSGDMSGLMTEAAIAIGACGGSAWERAALGIPSIALPIVDNQRHVADILRQAGAALVLTPPGATTAADIAQAASRLLDEPDLAATVGQHAEVLVDALGARRTLLNIDPERTGDGEPVVLRPATEADSMIMYDWQRHPETRRFANDPKPPGLDEHLDWLASRLKDPRCILSVVRFGTEDVGVVRVDFGEHRGRPAGVVSLYLAPGRSGHGLGSAALRAVRRLVPDILLKAEIDEKNAASRAAFAKAGYRQVDARWYTCDP